jgi:stage II sporulation protein R
VLSGYVKLSQDNEKIDSQVLRIHIRADSNQAQDQQVKYKVKDAVVEFLTPKLIDCDTKSKAEQTIKSLLPEIEKVCDKVLIVHGYEYKSKAKLNQEEFPTRVYGDLTLQQGYYDALIIELGSGKGDNWWCVVYPPLCFTGQGENYVYKSKLKQIINEFYEKQRG